MHSFPTQPRRRRLWIWAIPLVLLGGQPLHVAAQATSLPLQKHPDVVAVKVRVSGPGRFDFDVTVSSPYDTPGRYADAFRVSTAEGLVLGERKLLHDHADEQPFTRDLHGIAVPPGVKRVVVQARDSQFGYGGKTVSLLLPVRN
jgi:hypothetical protein